MKLKILKSSIICALIALSACTSEEKFDTGRDVNINALTLYAIEKKNESVQYPATIDHKEKTIKFVFPYYTSETEEIEPDFRTLRLIAALPQGTTLTPTLTGIQDVTKPMTITMNYMNGTKADYTLTAERVKLNQADIKKLVLPKIPLVTVGYGVKNEENKIFVYRTSSTIYDALKTAEVEFIISPWATSSVENGRVMDLTVRNEIVITAQDGTTKTYYTEMVDPEYVPVGQIGQINLLFGFQTTKADTRGFEEAKNRSIAISGSELVLGHIDGKFKRYDRYTGVSLDKEVNTTGILTGKGCLLGITSDDNGVLLAVSLAAANHQYIPNKDFEIYAWKNGLDNAPVKLISKTLPSADLPFLGATNEIGRTISVKGDVVSGVAQIMVLSNSLKTVVRYKVENGAITNATSPWTRTYGVAIGSSGKAIPMTNADDTDFILATGSTGKIHYRCTVNPASANPINAGGSWWGSDIKGSDYVEFNGLKLLATQNGNYSGTADAYNRLVVGDMTSYAADIFTSKRVMDSRLQNFDPNVSGAANATITGMTSFYVSGGATVGPNANKAGDVIFGSNEDGSAVQVYMITTDHGLIAYDISRFAPF